MWSHLRASLEFKRLHPEREICDQWNWIQLSRSSENFLIPFTGLVADFGRVSRSASGLDWRGSSLSPRQSRDVNKTFSGHGAKYCGVPAAYRLIYQDLVVWMLMHIATVSRINATNYEKAAHFISPSWDIENLSSSCYKQVHAKIQCGKGNAHKQSLTYTYNSFKSITIQCLQICTPHP